MLTSPPPQEDEFVMTVFAATAFVVTVFAATAFATDDAQAASGGASGGHESRWVLRSAAAAACQPATRARDSSLPSFIVAVAPRSA